MQVSSSTSHETIPLEQNIVRPVHSKVLRQSKNPIGSAFALFLKELIWRHIIRFTPTQRPICLYASRRSGSSLLMEVISVNQGVMFSDQPFGLYTASPTNINLMPLFPYGQIACPDADEEALLHEYVQGLLSGRERANLPWKFWRKEFHFSNDRLCLKITDAKTMILWMSEHFDVDTVVLTRHPIAQAVSVANVGWYPTGKGLLRNASYVQHWLDDDLVTYCWDRYRCGSELQWRVLDWALENLPMLRLLPEHPEWRYVSYEDLIAHTEKVVEHLSGELNLVDRQRMLARVVNPSRSTRRESTAERKQLIKEGNSHKLLNSWRSQLDDQELRSCFHVLDRFKIDLYQPDSPMPIHQRIGRTAFGFVE